MFIKNLKDTKTIKKETKMLENLTRTGNLVSSFVSLEDKRLWMIILKPLMSTSHHRILKLSTDFQNLRDHTCQ